MTDTLNAAELRRLALQYAAQADDARDNTERERFTKMREALLDLAQCADWLAGRRAA